MIVYDPDQDYTGRSRDEIKRELRFLRWYVKHLEEEIRKSKVFGARHIEAKKATLKYETRNEVRRAYRMGEIDKDTYARGAHSINAYNRLVQFEQDKLDFFETQLKNYKGLLMYFKEIQAELPEPKRPYVYKVKFRNPYKQMKLTVWDTDKEYAEKKKAKEAKSLLREESASDVESANVHEDSEG